MTVSQKVKDALIKENDDLAEVVEGYAPVARSVGGLYKSLSDFFAAVAAPASRIAATAAKAATTEAFSLIGRKQNEAAVDAFAAADDMERVAREMRDGSFWEEDEEDEEDEEEVIGLDDERSAAE